MSMEFSCLAELIKALGNYEKKGISDPRLIKDEKGKITLKAPTGQCELTDASGGFLVSGQILTPIARTIAQKSTIFSKATKFYTSKGKGVSAGWMPYLSETNRTEAANQFHCYWVEEGAEKTEAKFQFGVHQKPLNKLFAVVSVTEELWADSLALQQAIQEWICSPESGSLIWYIEQAMMYGNFATSMEGIFSAGATGVTGAATADPLDEASLKNFVKALAPSVQATSAWYMSKENYNDILDINFTDDQTITYENGRMILFGFPVYVMEQMYSPCDIMLGDWSHYGIAMHEGQMIESAISISLKFLTDEKTIRFGVRLNGASFGSVFALEDTTTVAPFVIPDGCAAVESSSSSNSSSSSSSEQYSSSSSSSSNSSSSNSSSSVSTQSSASSTSVSTSSSISSDSSSSISSESSSSISSSSVSSPSSESSELYSESSVSSDSSSSVSTESTSSSQSGMEGCAEDYCGSGFAVQPSWNATWTATGSQHDSKPVYYSAGAGLYLFYDTVYSTWAMAETIGAAPVLWKLTQVTPAACPNGDYDGDDDGTLVAGKC